MYRMFALLALVTVLPLACSDDDENDVEILTVEHEGWQDPVCADCHPDHHNSDLDNHECVECHGTNGAPEQPQSAFHTATCGDAAAGGPGCHDGEHGEPTTGFPTGECIACHPQATE